MHLFIKKILVFLFINITAIIVLYSIDANFIKEKVILSPKKDILVFGDSNTRRSFNDSIIKDIKNLSIGGESYLFAYIKMKKIIDDGNRIDTVLLAFSPHNIYDNEWLQKPGPLHHRFSKYYKYFSKEEHAIFLKNFPKDYIDMFFRNTYNISKDIYDHRQTISGYPRYLGSYDASYTKNIDKIKDKEYTTPLINYNKPIDLETLYLNKIDSLTKRNKIKLVLVTTPKAYNAKDFAKNYQVDKFYDYYYKNFAHLDYLDFTNFKLCDICYGDYFHITAKGASIFSNYFEQNGLKKLLNSSYKVPNKSL